MDYLTFLVLVLIAIMLLARYLPALFGRKERVLVTPREDIKNIALEIEKLKNLAKHNHALLNEVKLALQRRSRAKVPTPPMPVITKTVQVESF